MHTISASALRHAPIALVEGFLVICFGMLNPGGVQFFLRTGRQRHGQERKEFVHVQKNHPRNRHL